MLALTRTIAYGLAQSDESSNGCMKAALAGAPLLRSPRSPERADANQVAWTPHESLSVTARLKTGVPGCESRRSTQK